MPESWDAEYVAVPDDAGFTRAAIRAGILARIVQSNIMHLYGSRTVRLLSDVDLWIRVPAASGLLGVWHVTVPSGVTALLATAQYVATRYGPGPIAGNGVSLQFRSERGGAGVTSGTDAVPAALDEVVAATMDDSFLGPPRNPPGQDFDAASVDDGMDGVVTHFPWALRLVGGSVAGAWQTVWAPNLTTSQEQRIVLRGSGDGYPFLWGVQAFGVVPTGG